MPFLGLGRGWSRSWSEGRGGCLPYDALWMTLAIVIPECLHNSGMEQPVPPRRPRIFFLFVYVFSDLLVQSRQSAIKQSHSPGKYFSELQFWEKGTPYPLASMTLEKRPFQRTTACLSPSLLPSLPPIRPPSLFFLSFLFFSLFFLFLY